MASGVIFQFITLHEKEHELKRFLCRSLHRLATCIGCLHLREHLLTRKVLDRASRCGPSLRGELSLVLLHLGLIRRALRFGLHAVNFTITEILVIKSNFLSYKPTFLFASGLDIKNHAYQPLAHFLAIAVAAFSVLLTAR